ncbi:hypothetical protein IQ07DRAFT_593578 [Pyrenochaeta sp. DS3sAY3a]|nr:hypothetical protein IQ07DRAFT_593578 [Pyrenochaeta sp. DS3sAY3a]
MSYQLAVCSDLIQAAPYRKLTATRITPETFTNSNIMNHLIGWYLHMGKFLLECVKLSIEGFEAWKVPSEGVRQAGPNEHVR